MRHLRLVPDPVPSGVEHVDPVERTTHPHLTLADLPAPRDAAQAEVDFPALPEPDPALAAMFGQMDLLFDGLTEPEASQALRTLYFDAAGRPQARSLLLKLA